MWLENPKTGVIWFIEDSEKVSELKALGYTEVRKESEKPIETPKKQRTNKK